MEITKEQLEEYRSKKAEIKELDYKLNNRWKSEYMLGADTIFDYSKGYPIPQAVIGFDQKKYESQQNSDLRRKTRLEKECEEIENFVNNIESSTTRRIFQLYYLDGAKKPTQKEVGKKVFLNRSNVSRKIDEFLKNAHNAQNAHL